MLEVRLYIANDIRIYEVGIPEINDNEILLEVKSVAICDTCNECVSGNTHLYFDYEDSQL